MGSTSRAEQRRSSDSRSRRGSNSGCRLAGTTIDTECRASRPWTLKIHRPYTCDGHTCTRHDPASARWENDCRIVSSTMATIAGSSTPSTSMKTRGRMSLDFKPPRPGRMTCSDKVALVMDRFVRQPHQSGGGTAGRAPDPSSNRDGTRHGFVRAVRPDERHRGIQSDARVVAE
jgi:hypothetical protein